MCDGVCRGLPMDVIRIQVDYGYARRVRLMYRIVAEASALRLKCGCA